jgi:hypothetical protein
LLTCRRASLAVPRLPLQPPTSNEPPVY